MSIAFAVLHLRTAIPFVMGANLGTSVTNTIVALTHISNRVDFERVNRKSTCPRSNLIADQTFVFRTQAFGGAVLHDMFNLLTVSTLLPLEQLTSMLTIVCSS